MMSCNNMFHGIHAYELLIVITLKFSPMGAIHIFQCMGAIFGVEFQMEPWECVHAKYLTAW